MSSYHPNMLTGNAVKCPLDLPETPAEPANSTGSTPGTATCPKGVLVSLHSSTPEGVKAAFWHYWKNLTSDDTQAPQTITESDRSSNARHITCHTGPQTAPEPFSRPFTTPHWYNYPTDALGVLRGFLAAYPYEPIGITPSGSLLYNTSVNPEPKDLDFVVFLEPHDDLTKFRRAQIGPVDLFLVPIDKLVQYTTSTSQVGEAFLATIAGHALWTSETHIEVWNNAELIRTVEQTYKERLSEHVRKHRDREYDDDRLEREHKHYLRWKQYVARDQLFPFDPRLSNIERESFLAEWNQRPGQE